MKAVIWSKPDCPNCVMARKLLENKGIEIEERKLGFGWNREQLFEAIPNAKSVPQIFLDGIHIGGYENLKKYFEAK